MNITYRIVTEIREEPYPEIQIHCKKHCSLSHGVYGSTYSTYHATPDELEIMAGKMLELSHALRAELAAYEERKGQAQNQDEVQP
jgi:hypothetical protein